MAEVLARASRFLRRRPYSLLGLILLAVLVVPFLRRDQDWVTVYVPAAQRLVAGQDIYQQGFVYPPINAWLAIPFVDLPRLPAQLLAYAVNTVALAVLLLGAWQLSGGGRLEGMHGVPWREHWIFWLGLSCGIFGCFDAITNQQTDLVVAALVILGCLALMRERHLRGAVWFGVAAGIKCTPLLWAGYLAWRKRWVAAGLVVIVAAAVNLLPDLTYPAPAFSPRLGLWAQRYLMPMAERECDLGVWSCGIGGNQSVAGIWQRWLVYEAVWNGADLDVTPRAVRATPDTLKAVSWATLFLLIAAALASTWTAQPCRGQPGAAAPPQVLEFGLVLILMVLMSPHSSKPHFCTLLLPGFCVARAALNWPNRRLLGLLVAAVACAFLTNKDLVGDHIYAWAKWHGSIAGCAVILHLASCRVLLSGKAFLPALQPNRSSSEAAPLRRSA